MHIKRTPAIIIILITSVFSVFYFLIGINSWKFSFVGDEWSFYTYAKYIVDSNFLIIPFSFNGVYLQNSVLASFYQALFIKLLGYNNFAWRFSNIILIIPISILFLKWMQNSFNNTIAVLSTIILQSSYYLANFFKIGYINPQALALFIACVYVASLISKKPSIIKLFILGILLGYSFFIYLGPIFPFIIWPYFIPYLKKISLKRHHLHALFFLIGYLIFLIPAFLQIQSWAGPEQKTIFHKEYSSYFQVFSNIKDNFLIFFGNFAHSDFLHGPYLGFFSAVLAFVGMVLCITKIKKHEFFNLILLYVTTCVVFGIFSPYNHPAETRGMFFLPFGFSFAGIALFYLFKNYRHRVIFYTLSLLTIFLLNLYISQIGVFNNVEFSQTSLIIKTLQDVKNRKVKEPITLLISKENDFNYYNLHPMIQAYGLSKIKLNVKNYLEINCKILSTNRIIVFKLDSETVNYLNKLNCANSKPTYFI